MTKPLCKSPVELARCVVLAMLFACTQRQIAPAGQQLPTSAGPAAASATPVEQRAAEASSDHAGAAGDMNLAAAGASGVVPQFIANIDANSATAGTAGTVQPFPPDAAVADIAALAAALASAVCDALRSCLGPAQLAVLTGREECDSSIRATLQQDDFGTLDDSLLAGRVVIDPSQLSDCYRDTRALGCALPTERLPESCQLAIAGKRGLGESCLLHADCGGDAFCPASCPRTCQPVRSPGAACSGDAECRRGLICLENRCSAPAAQNAACGGSSASVCALGASCVGGSQTDPGTCQLDQARQVGALGATCADDGTLCREGLSCAYDGSAHFTCQAQVAHAGSCHLAVPGQCPIDSYCDAVDAKTSGTCSSLPRAGQACVLGNQCAAGHVCVAQGQLAICQRRSDLGDSCASDAVCRSGICLAGHCVVRPRCS